MTDQHQTFSFPPASNSSCPLLYQFYLYFQLSMVLRYVHVRVTETYGYPYWVSYVIFALGTILLGGVLGLLLVCLVDCCCPSLGANAAYRRHQHQYQQSYTDAQKKVRNYLFGFAI